LDTLPDADLVARAKAGDREAFDPLYRRYAGDVARHAVARVASWGRGLDVADDAAADTWATAIEKIDQYQGLPCEGSPFKAWLYGILKHQVVKTVRADRAVPVDDAAALDRAVRDLAVSWASTSSADDEARHLVTRARIYQAIVGLAPAAQETARLRLIDGLRLVDIAAETGQTYQQVKNHWRYAQARLQRVLGGEAADDGDAVSQTVTRLRALDDMAMEGAITGELDRERSELRTSVYQAVAGMRTSTLREIARLRLIDGLSPVEIADKTGWSKKQVWNGWASASRDLNGILAGAADDGDVVSQTLTRLRALDDMAGDQVITGELEGERAELRARVDAAVAGLSPKLRTVAELRVAGVDPADIAEQAGCAYQAACARWSMAKGALENALTPHDTQGAEDAQDAQAAHARLSGTIAEHLGPDRVRELGTEMNHEWWTPAGQADEQGPAREPEPSDVADVQALSAAGPDAAAATSDATAAPTADASPVHARQAAVDDSADARADASTPDTQPVTEDDIGPDMWPDTGPACHYAGTANDDGAGWRPERQLVGAGVRAGDGRDRARVDVDDDADGW